MSFSVSDLLNPAPGPDTSSQDARKNSLPPLQVPNPYQTQLAHQNQDGSAHDASVKHEFAAQALTSLHADATPLPTTWNGFDQRITQSPPTLQGTHRSPQETRRPSLYGENGTHLPHPADVLRKMSSPTADQHHFTAHSPDMRRPSYDNHRTHNSHHNVGQMASPSLEQYKTGSRSPEQRRASIYSQQGGAFTLPPLQSLPVQSSQSPQLQHHRPQSSHSAQSLGQDGSCLVSGFERRTSSHGLVHDTQVTQSQREPDYTRHEPNTHQPINPDGVAKSHPEQAGTEQDSAQPISPSAVKTEPSHTLHSSIPAFVPVPQVRRDTTSIAQSPPREHDNSTMPVQTTEVMSSQETKGKKRPAPKPTNKKGTAAKKGPPAKKRKTDALDKPKVVPGRGGTKSKKIGSVSASATPMGSSPAPQSTRTSSSAEPDADSDGERVIDDDESPGSAGVDDELYCICRRPDSGTFMIGCDGGCDDWFHGKCVSISERDKYLIDRYMCPNCTKKNLGVTTWKRMCRREGCRMPARIPKKKGETPSKYCSDECGVAFFSEMVDKTRGAPDAYSGKKATRKKSAVTEGIDFSTDDLGARGGVLSAAELKSLISSTSDIDKFKQLGDGVLSPPATPSLKPDGEQNTSTTNGDAALHDALSEPEIERIQHIQTGKDGLRTRHALLKDRLKFIGMLKKNAENGANERDLKPKEMCGYDERVHWDEDRFAKWAGSKIGRTALEMGTLETAGRDADGDEDMDGLVNGSAEDDEVEEMCTRRKCARHYDWSKLAIDDTRFEISENGEKMRALDHEEREVRERAGLRARERAAGDVGGTVEVHEDGESGVEQADDDDAAAPAGAGAQNGVQDAPDEPVSNGILLDGVTSAAQEA